MVPHKYRKANLSSEEDVDSMETNEDIDDVDSVEITTPSSPGLESLIEAKRNDSKRLKKKEKHCETWECIRLIAEYCARQPTHEYNSHLEVLKVFTGLMKNGLPADVISTILKYKEKDS